jgi:hypothetical protein
VTEIVLVKQQVAAIPEADREAARRVIFGVIDGLSPAHKKSWRRIWRWFLERAEPGEMLEIITHRERLGWYHRKHMAMEQAVFEAQEKFDSFEQFRLWLKVGAGFVDWIAGPKGGVVPIPKSISYAKLEQDDMERVHADIVAFLRTEHAQKALWPNLPVLHRDAAMRGILEGFHE